MKRMLFNATQAEELRVAIVDGQKLIDLDIESAAKEQRKSNIYKAVITRIEPSLEAAFVDYGAERHGFLPFKEISRSYFRPDVEPGKARIQDALKEGQELIVQVEKDERGNKGAALTTFVSLAGRYLVLMPNNPRGGGVSRRVEGDERAELREVLDQLQVPQGMSIIARTAAIGRNAEELQWDLNYLLQLWKAIEGAAGAQTGAFLIYQEGSLVIRAIRDYFQPDIGEILVDTDDIFEQARQFMGHVMPQNVNRVKRYRDDVPLFSRFQIEHQIESAYARQVILPSGGAIVIDHTEALVAVDVNSGRATRGADIEETALRTNCEAADEIARQLRLRDLGGLIVIDFIDMEAQRNQREVEQRLRDALHFDRARVQMGKISRFGLLELSRQRLRPALAETSYIPCPRCTGTGHIRSTESAALHILRILEEEAMKENTAAVHTQVPVDVATFLLNEKRTDINAIQLRHKVAVLIIPNIHLETPAHSVIRLRHDQLNQDDASQPSYRLADAPVGEVYTPPSGQSERQPRQEAAVKGITPDQPPPAVETKPEAAPVPLAAPPQGFFSKLFSWFRGSQPAPAPTPEVKAEPQQTQRREQKGRDSNRRNNPQQRSRRDERGERAERPERNERNGRDRDQTTAARADSSDTQPQAPTREPRQNRPQRGEPRGDNRNETRNGEERETSDNRGNETRDKESARPPRPPRQPRQQQNATSPEPLNEANSEASAFPASTESAPAAGENGEPRRSRNRRGRRDRGERRDEAPAETTAQEAGAVAAAATAVAAVAGAQTFAAPVPVSETPPPSVEPQTQVVATDAVVAEVVTTPTARQEALPPVPLETPVTAVHLDETAAASNPEEAIAPVPLATAPETVLSAVPAVPATTAREATEAAELPAAEQQTSAAAPVAQPESLDAVSTIEAAMAAVATPQGLLPEVAAPSAASGTAEPVQSAPALLATIAPQVAPAEPEALEQVGLVLVETSRSKAEAWQTTLASVEATPPAPRRRPRPVAQVADEPLLQVETRK